MGGYQYTSAAGRQEKAGASSTKEEDAQLSRAQVSGTQEDKGSQASFPGGVAHPPRRQPAHVDHLGDQQGQGFVTSWRRVPGSPDCPRGDGFPCRSHRFPLRLPAPALTGDMAAIERIAVEFCEDAAYNGLL